MFGTIFSLLLITHSAKAIASSDHDNQMVNEDQVKRYTPTVREELSSLRRALMDKIEAAQTPDESILHIKHKEKGKIVSNGDGRRNTIPASRARTLIFAVDYLTDYIESTEKLCLNRLENSKNYESTRFFISYLKNFTRELGKSIEMQDGKLTLTLDTEKIGGALEATRLYVESRRKYFNRPFTNYAPNFVNDDRNLIRVISTFYSNLNISARSLDLNDENISLIKQALARLTNNEVPCFFDTLADEKKPWIDPKSAKLQGILKRKNIPFIQAGGQFGLSIKLGDNESGIKKEGFLKVLNPDEKQVGESEIEIEDGYDPKTDIATFSLKVGKFTKPGIYKIIGIEHVSDRAGNKKSLKFPKPIPFRIENKVSDTKPPKYHFDQGELRLKKVVQEREIPVEPENGKTVVESKKLYRLGLHTTDDKSGVRFAGDLVVMGPDGKRVKRPVISSNHMLKVGTAVDFELHFNVDAKPGTYTITGIERIFDYAGNTTKVKFPKPIRFILKNKHFKNTPTDFTRVEATAMATDAKWIPLPDPTNNGKMSIRMTDRIRVEIPIKGKETYLPGYLLIKDSDGKILDPNLVPSFGNAPNKNDNLKYLISFSPHQKPGDYTIIGISDVTDKYGSQIPFVKFESPIKFRIQDSSDMRPIVGRNKNSIALVKFKSQDERIKKLVKALADRNYRVRSKAMETLFLIGAEARKELLNALTNKDREVAQRAKKALTAIDNSTLP